MSFIVDSSIAMTWCFKDEITEATKALLLRATNDGAYVPSLWSLEVVNVLLMAQRRGRLSPEKRQKRLALLYSLPITVDMESVEQAWTVTNFLAERHKLTLYDAAYLELAQRLNLPLATLDAELRAAAKAARVPLLGSPTDCE